MPKPDITRRQVLERLAAELDDTVLARLFPEADAALLRQLIRGEKPAAAAKPVVPVPKGTNPVSGCCRLFTDGASRGNPGQAGAGALLLAPDGTELAACSSYLGICTNNVAEYLALLFGLDEALMQGCTEIALSLDSELVVRQVEGRYKVKNETLLPLFTEVQKRLKRFHRWTITHVPRSQNSRADQLANEGIDNK